MDPVRPGDEAGAEVVVPTAEVFPGGSPERPWREEDGTSPLHFEYAAGGAYASLDGAGSIRVRLDDASPREVAVAAPGLVELASHRRHEEHVLSIDPGEGLDLYSVSFAPGVP